MPTDFRHGLLDQELTEIINLLASWSTQARWLRQEDLAGRGELLTNEARELLKALRTRLGKVDAH